MEVTVFIDFSHALIDVRIVWSFVITIHQICITFSRNLWSFEVLLLFLLVTVRKFEIFSFCRCVSLFTSQNKVPYFFKNFNSFLTNSWLIINNEPAYVSVKRNLLEFPYSHFIISSNISKIILFVELMICCWCQWCHKSLTYFKSNLNLFSFASSYKLMSNHLFFYFRCSPGIWKMLQNSRNENSLPAAKSAGTISTVTQLGYLWVGSPTISPRVTSSVFSLNTEKLST